MFYLEVEMPCEPVVERAGVDVTCGLELNREPVLIEIFVDFHRQMTHLGHPRKPVALQESEINKRYL